MRQIFRPRPPVFRIISRDPCRIRLDEWRATPDLVKQASQALANPIFRQMVEVCRNEHLGNECCVALIPIEQRAVLQARSEGYAICLNNLESLAVFQKPKETLESTFEEPAEEAL